MAIKNNVIIIVIKIKSNFMFRKLATIIYFIMVLDINKIRVIIINVIVMVIGQ